MKNSKGQMEIMGLLMIVILITVILMIVLTLDATKDDAQPEQTAFFQEQIIGSMSTTIMETTSECDNKILREIMAECAYSDTQCRGMDSCEYLNTTIEGILEKTLDKAGLNYSLEIHASNQIITMINYGGCNARNSKTSKSQINPIDTTYGPLNMNFTLCN